LTQPEWQIRLGVEAKKDFARILTDTQATFGPLQAEIYQQTLLEALAALGEGPNILGSKARDEIRPNSGRSMSRAVVVAVAISSCIGEGRGT
jgi:toxin ParE1/3/4